MTSEIEISPDLITDEEYEHIRKLSEENAKEAIKMMEIRALHVLFGCPEDCKICLPSGICDGCGREYDG